MISNKKELFEELEEFKKLSGQLQGKSTRIKDYLKREEKSSNIKSRPDRIEDFNILDKIILMNMGAQISKINEKKKMSDFVDFVKSKSPEKIEIVQFKIYELLKLVSPEMKVFIKKNNIN